MESDEDRSANLAVRSHLASGSRSCGLTGSIVPATGPASSAWCPPELAISSFVYALAAALPATNSVLSAGIARAGWPPCTNLLGCRRSAAVVAAGIWLP